MEALAKQPMSRYGRRVMAECRYAREVSREDHGQWDRYIDLALALMEQSIQANGAIGDDAAQEAETALLPIGPAAKRIAVICTGHAHIDMNWLWRYDETVAITLETFRTVLQLMEEYPQFVFSQSQASVYEIVEEFAPDVLKQIQRRVAQGRWEVTASTWVEADRNMPSGESAARQLFYTRRYLSELLHIAPQSLTLDFEPDTFGHSATTPEILSQSGVKYQYHCRGDEGEVLYRWRGQSGAEILCFRDPAWYLGPVEPEMVLGIPALCSRYNIDTMLRVYGVGDHGGGPTRRDIERLTDMAKWPVFPTLRFGTYAEFFAAVEHTPGLPVVQGELNPVFTGCYTSQSRITQGNRLAEARMAEAEMFSAQAGLRAGLPYRHTVMEKAWRMILFNQFHDILPGSCLIDGREYAMGQYARVFALADTQKLEALRALAKQADTSAWMESAFQPGSTAEGGGVGYGIGSGLRITQTERGRGKRRIFHVFNPSAVPRREIVELTLFDWPGEIKRLKMADGQGNALPVQLLDHVPQHYWQHTFIRVLAEVSVEAGGRSLCVCGEDLLMELPTPQPAEPRVEKPQTFVLENDRLRAEFVADTGMLVSLVNRKYGRQYIDSPGAGFDLIDEQPAENTAGTAWTIGRYRSIMPMHSDVTMRKFNTGELRNAVTVKTFGRESSVTYTVSLAKGADVLDIDCDVDWREIGIPGERTPQLSFRLPLLYGEAPFIHDVPGGILERPSMPQDMPCQSFAAAIMEPGLAMMMISDSTYGFRCESEADGGVCLRLNCLRSSSDPDPYPEFGRHRFRIGIGFASDDKVDLLNQANAFCHPLTPISDLPRKGILPPQAEGIAVTGAFLQAVKLAEDTEHLLVRLSCPDTGQAAVTLWAAPKAAYFVDVHEQAVESEIQPECRGRTISLPVRGGSIVTLCIEL